MSSPFGFHSGQYVNNRSEVESKQFTAAFSQITQGFRVAMEHGLAADREGVQELVSSALRFLLTVVARTLFATPQPQRCWRQEFQFTS